MPRHKGDSGRATGIEPGLSPKEYWQRYKELKRYNQAEASARSYQWAKDNPEKIKEGYKRYLATENGQQKRKEQWARWYKRRRDFTNAFKVVPCMDCGVEYPPYVMDFDHRDPKDKDFTISANVRSKSLETLRQEIAKCDVVCANCHRERTWGANSKARH